MWIEDTPAGTYKYCERFENEFTGTTHKVCITKKQKNTSIRRAMPELLRKKFEKKHAPQTQHATHDITYRELMDQWMAYNKNAWKPGTYHSYKSAIATMPDYLLDTLVSKLSAVMINKFLRDRVAGGASESWVNSSAVIMRRTLTYGLDANFDIDPNIPVRIKHKVPQLKKDEMKFLTHEELEDVQAQLIENSVPTYADMAFIQATTGLRAGEAIGLRVGDVDLEHKVLRATRTYNQATSSFHSPKNGKGRDVHLIDAAYERLYTLIEERKKQGARDDEPVFLNRWGYMAKYSGYAKALRSVRIEDKNVTSHIFRHTYITMLIDEGIPFHLIAIQVGHENTKLIEEIYGHFTDKSEEQLKDGLGKIKL